MGQAGARGLRDGLWRCVPGMLPAIRALRVACLLLNEPFPLARQKAPLLPGWPVHLARIQVWSGLRSERSLCICCWASSMRFCVVTIRIALGHEIRVFFFKPGSVFRRPD